MSWPTYYSVCHRYLKLFRNEELHWYEIMCSGKFHFYLNFLVDVLQELNKLNIKFQYDMVDITTSSATINNTISILSCHFKSGNGPMFGHTSKNLGKFSRDSARNLHLSYENNTRRSYYSCIDNWWAQWTTIMHIIGCTIYAKSCSCFEWSVPGPSSIQCSQTFEPS